MSFLTSLHLEARTGFELLVNKDYVILVFSVCASTNAKVKPLFCNNIKRTTSQFPVKKDS